MMSILVSIIQSCFKSFIQRNLKIWVINIGREEKKIFISFMFPWEGKQEKQCKKKKKLNPHENSENTSFIK